MGLHKRDAPSLISLLCLSQGTLMFTSQNTLWRHFRDLFPPPPLLTGQQVGEMGGFSLHPYWTFERRYGACDISSGATAVIWSTESAGRRCLPTSYSLQSLKCLVVLVLVPHSSRRARPSVPESSAWVEFSFSFGFIAPSPRFINGNRIAFFFGI